MLGIVTRSQRDSFRLDTVDPFSGVEDWEWINYKDVMKDADTDSYVHGRGHFFLNHDGKLIGRTMEMLERTCNVEKLFIDRKYLEVSTIAQLHRERSM